MSSRYESIPASAVPSNVRFDVLAHRQGQIVEVAYGGTSRHEHDVGDMYRRITDRSCSPSDPDRVRYARLVKP